MMPRTLAISGDVPTWSLGDRLRKAREHAGLTQEDMGAELDVSRRSIGAYESGTTPLKRPQLIAWALRTGVDLAWLAGESAAGHPKVTTTPNGSSSADTVDTGIYFHGTTSSHRPRAIRCNRAQRMRNVA